MGAALGQEHTAYLRIGAWSILIAAATKGRCVGGRIGRVEDRAIDGHESIATKESTGHARRLGDQLTALTHQGLQALAAQFLATSAQSRVADRTLWLSRMQIAEFAHQALPHLALIATAPQRHRDHKEHERQGRA